MWATGYLYPFDLRRVYRLEGNLGLLLLSRRGSPKKRAMSWTTYVAIPGAMVAIGTIAWFLRMRVVEARAEAIVQMARSQAGDAEREATIRLESWIDRAAARQVEKDGKGQVVGDSIRILVP